MSIWNRFWKKIISFFGFSVESNVPVVPEDDYIIDGDIKRASVSIGLTKVDSNSFDYNGWDGDCPGCDVDVIGITNALSIAGFKTNLLFNKDANWKNVRATILRVAKRLKRDDLLVITMSGHGGQLPDDNGDEWDGIDETICFWDKQIRDDEILKMIHLFPAGLRVVMINDQCHSEGNFRSMLRKVQNIITLGHYGTFSAVPLDTRGFDWDGQLIQFAGCREAHYSYGSSKGGTWTQTLLRVLKPNLTWYGWFNAARQEMPAQQIPVWTEYGNVKESFREGPVLK